VLFVFSLLFSLLLHSIFKKNQPEHETVPLAGYMSLFFGSVYIADFFFDCNFLYAY
jgi:hypothetical protein